MLVSLKGMIFFLLLGNFVLKADKEKYMQRVNPTLVEKLSSMGDLLKRTLHIGLGQIMI